VSETYEFCLQIEAPVYRWEVSQRHAGQTNHHDCSSSQYLYCLIGHQRKHCSDECYERQLLSAEQEAEPAAEELYMATSVQTAVAAASTELGVAAADMAGCVVFPAAEQKLVHSVHDRCHEDQSAEDTRQVMTKILLLVSALW